LSGVLKSFVLARGAALHPNQGHFIIAAGQSVAFAQAFTLSNKQE
jgi:hypothetical protein